jgi:uncharacterized caspase-like protein
LEIYQFIGFGKVAKPKTMKNILLYTLLLLSVTAKSQNIIWLSPNADKYQQKPYVSETATLEIEVKILASTTPKRDDITILRDGTAITGKNGEGVMQYTTYTNTVALKNGEQTIVIQYKDKYGTHKSPPLKVFYAAGKPSLHVFAIGTNPADLQYTAHDAWDFANAFRGQATGSSALFKKVKVKTLIGEEATAAAMRQMVNSAATDYRMGEIQPQDVVILFVSTHGFVDEFDKQLYLKGDDYNAYSNIATSLGYQEILNMFNRIPCKKLIFLDACYSGAGKRNSNSKAINDAIQQLSRTQDGLVTMTSSSEDQVSYEDDAWENGAFTEALLQGLQGKADGSDGSDKNGIISLDELYTYANTTVPQLVKNKKSEIQIPNRTRDDLGNLALFATANFDKNTLPFPKGNMPEPPKKPNLYILSIGTSPPDVRYMAKDAEDFANLYEKQIKLGTKGLFEEVTIKKLIGFNAKADDIRKEIDYLYLKGREGYIKSEDIIVIYISAHSKIYDERLYIQGNDYEIGKIRSTAVNYNELVASLNEISCKKLIFLDVCYSGYVKRISKITDIDTDIVTFASSSSSEVSYEHQTWQNGAFTEAILRGLSGRADKNKNNIITVNELFFYIETTVPKIVKEETKRQQNPILTRSNLGDLPIFVVD